LNHPPKESRPNSALELILAPSLMEPEFRRGKIIGMRYHLVIAVGRVMGKPNKQIGAVI